MECNIRLYGGIRKQSDSKEISLLVMRMGKRSQSPITHKQIETKEVAKYEVLCCDKLC